MPRKPSTSAVVGLDLSLRCSAAVYLPRDWSPLRPTEGVEWTTCGYGVAKDDWHRRNERLRDIAAHLSEFVRAHYTPHVFVEGSAFAQSAYQGVRLGEGIGAVKAFLLDRLGVSVLPVHMGNARKLFLGLEKLPKKAQVLVARRVLEMGFPFPTSDPGDSLVIASYGRTELGMEGIVCG
jgi:Holliday junction resolvasome RuvABC endonuclease subunit